MKTISYNNRFSNRKLSIHWTLLLPVLWVIVANFLTGPRLEEFSWSLLLLLAYFASLLAHELGHLILARNFKIPISGILLLPIGGISEFHSRRAKPWQLLLVGIGGPLVNLIIAGLLLFYIHPWQAYWNDLENVGVASADNFLFQIQLINLALGLINFIPAFPMDGGKILSTVLYTQVNREEAIYITGIFSRVIAYGMIFYSIMSLKLAFVLLAAFMLMTIHRAQDALIKLKRSDKSGIFSFIHQ